MTWTMKKKKENKRGNKWKEKKLIWKKTIKITSNKRKQTINEMKKEKEIIIINIQWSKIDKNGINLRH